VALARCENCKPQVELKNKYRHRHMVGQVSPFMCGALKCAQWACYVWLSDAEQRQYIGGKRLFGVRSRRGPVELR
jgi:hypothetical protein